MINNKENQEKQKQEREKQFKNALIFLTDENVKFYYSLNEKEKEYIKDMFFWGRKRGIFLSELIADYRIFRDKVNRRKYVR